MTDRDDLDMLAAEFVLGTLDADERASVTRRLVAEPELNALVEEWEVRLAPLADSIQPVTPDPELFARIERQIDAEQHTPTEQPSPANSTVIALRTRLRRWQWSTGVASAAALLLIAVLVLQPRPESAPQSFVAVFQQNDQQPAFMLSVDLNTRQLSIRPVTAEPLQEKSYQLWIKADPLGPDPRSLGVLNDNFELDRAAALQNFDPELLKQATFGISIEPAGGSPTGLPTSPAIHGFLYPVSGTSGQ
ncbi:MAG: anti-sigma factor [Marinobacter sp.]|uniref:anti-sigma factor n=1 Tax=Marinobacter sp. TaxID=50741 RepID=UPI0034A099F4